MEDPVQIKMVVVVASPRTLQIVFNFNRFLIDLKPAYKELIHEHKLEQRCSQCQLSTTCWSSKKIKY